MKTLIIHPPIRAVDKPRHIPLGPGMLLAMIKDKHECALADLNAARDFCATTEDVYAYLKECLESTKWDYVGISGLSSQYKYIKNILPMIRKTNPQAIILAGCGWITYRPKEMMMLNPEIDITCVGEGEITIQEICDGKSPKDIKGIWYRENGELVATQPRGLIADIDSLPYPEYSLIPMEIYFKYSSTMDSLEAMNAKRRVDGCYERGCPRSCAFCSHNGASRYDLVMIHGKEKVREMDEEYGFQNVARWNSPKYIAEHTWYLINEFNCDFVMNLDENLCSNKKRVFEMCDRFISEGLNKKIKWGSLGDSASVSDEMLYKMKEAGCTYISYGGESASDRILLKDIGKGTTRAHNQHAVDCMRRVGLRPLMTFQIGFPSETIDDILETTDFFVKNNIKSDCFLDCAYPGTKYFAEHYEFLLRQYDPSIEKDSSLEKKLAAEERFLIDLDDATDLSATVSQNFTGVELLGLKALVANNDMRRICNFAHESGRTHAPKWDEWCDYCSQTKKLIINQ